MYLLFYDYVLIFLKDICLGMEFFLNRIENKILKDVIIFVYEKYEG